MATPASPEAATPAMPAPLGHGAGWIQRQHCAGDYGRQSRFPKEAKYRIFH